MKANDNAPRSEKTFFWKIKFWYWYWLTFSNWKYPIRLAFWTPIFYYLLGIKF